MSQDRVLAVVTEVAEALILSVSKDPSMNNWYLANPDSESEDEFHDRVGLVILVIAVELPESGEDREKAAGAVVSTWKSGFPPIDTQEPFPTALPTLACQW